MSAISASLRLPVRAEQVLAALRHFARSGLVCERTGSLAHWLGVSTETVRRGLDDLLRLGLIERTTLRSGNAVQYRLIESPQPDVESSQLIGAVQTATPPTFYEGGVARFHRHSSKEESSHRGSPMSSEDRQDHDKFEVTPELCAEYAALARAHADRYSSRGSPSAVLRRRRSLRDEQPERSRSPNVGERYFRRTAIGPRIWLPPTAQDQNGDRRDHGDRGDLGSRNRQGGV